MKVFHSIRMSLPIQKPAYHDAVAKPEEWYTSALAAFGIGSDD